MNERARTALILAGLVALGTALRLFRLGDVPFGFHPDEGHNALDALRILEGARPVFLERNNGREPLFMALMAATMGAFGPSIWSARLAGVVAGALMIPVQYGFVRGLPLPGARRTALVSAALVATAFWPVAQARYALRANLLPLWVGLMLWAWWKVLAVERSTSGSGVAGARSWPAAGWAALAGLFLAGAVHTHLTGRLLPLVLVGSAVWVATRGRSTRPLAALAVALVVATAVALPQLLFFRDHPEMLSYRAEQVSVLNPAVHEGDLPGTLIENGWRLVVMPFWRGDTSWYHNLPRRPVFTDLVALAFLIGLAVRARDVLGRRGPAAEAAAVLGALTLAVTLAPSWLSVGAPNYVRLTGIWPVLFLLPAWGLDRAAAWLEDRDRPHGAARPAAAAAIVLVLALQATRAANDYFGPYAASPKVYAAFNGAAVERGDQVAALVAEGPTYVSPAIWQQSVIRFINQAVPPGTFDPRAGLVLPPDDAGADVRYAFDPVELTAADAFGRRWPGLERTDPSDSSGQRALAVFRWPRDRWPAPAGADAARFGDHIALEGVAITPAVARPGGSIGIALRWRALAPTGLDHNLFVHLVAADGRTVAQHDGPPLGGSYPTDRWRAGERILETVTLDLAPDAPPGPVAVRVGWYDWRDGTRLPVAGADDATVEISTLSVAP